MIDIAEYYELHTLSFEAFLEKRGHWGFSFGDALEIRFPKGVDLSVQMAKLLDPVADYFFFPISLEKEVFTGKWEHVKQYCSSIPEISHFILADQALTWILVKDEFNKLIGVGEAIQEKIASKMHRNPRLCFDDTEILYHLSPKKQE